MLGFPDKSPLKYRIQAWKKKPKLRDPGVPTAPPAVGGTAPRRLSSASSAGHAGPTLRGWH